MNRIIHKETYTNGQAIFKEGSYGETLYVILSGKVEISKMINGEKVSIAFLSKGEIFGEISFIDKKPRTASVMAVGSVEVGLIDQDFIDHEVNRISSEFGVILNALTERLRKTTANFVNLKAEYDQLKTEYEKLKRAN